MAQMLGQLWEAEGRRVFLGRKDQRNHTGEKALCMTTRQFGLPPPTRRSPKGG